MTKKQLIALGFIIALTGIILFADSSTLTQPSKLKGEFTEVAFYRNENNTGPVIRIYAVRVKQPEGAAYKDYGDAMPHTPHGTTKIFFFDEKDPAPETLGFAEPHFDTQAYQALQVYKKNAVGEVSLQDLR